MHGQFSTTESGELEHSPKSYISEQKVSISHARFEKPQIFATLEQRITEQHILSLSHVVEANHCGLNHDASEGGRLSGFRQYSKTSQDTITMSLEISSNL
jgi:hypothetical protein